MRALVLDGYIRCQCLRQLGGSSWSHDTLLFHIVCLDHIDISSPGHHWTHIAAAILTSAHDISCFVDNLILICELPSLPLIIVNSRLTHWRVFRSARPHWPPHLLSIWWILLLLHPSVDEIWYVIHGCWLNRPSWYNIYMTCTAAAPIIDLSQIGPAPMLPPFYIYPLCSHSKSYSPHQTPEWKCLLGKERWKKSQIANTRFTLLFNNSGFHSGVTD